MSFLAPRGAEAIELGAESNDCMETSMANLQLKNDSYFSAMIERWLFLPWNLNIPLFQGLVFHNLAGRRTRT